MNNSEENLSTYQRSFYIQWHFTENCNLRCKHCYQKNYDLNDISEQELMRIAEMLDNAMNVWKRKGRVSLTGGEPFLKEDILFNLMDFFNDSEHFYWVGILTNGTLINQNIAKKLKTYPKLKEIQISIDGATSETHNAIRGQATFERAIEGLKCLILDGIKTSVMFTLTALNKTEVIDIIDLCLNLGVNALTVERVTPINNEEKLSLNINDIKNVYEQIAGRKKLLGKNSLLHIRTSRPLWCLTNPQYGGFCPAGFTSLCILYDGSMLPCRRLEIPLGNILNDGIFKIWYTSPVLWDLRQKNRMNSTCRLCDFLSQCGGCRAMAYAQHGDYLATDPHCWKGIST
ncbi:MAG: hypothetical protein BWK80_04770 [Desulfobacteraceae bacterium IS3]|nr:MAG: hypothetical protein BWK80_04770 [Desulfobacteraceae bacterium IS3]